MSRAVTLSIQKKLKNRLRSTLNTKVEIETPPFDDWEGRPDITITGANGIFIIEIEHFSNKNQAIKNVKQASSWAQKNPETRISFLTLLHAESTLNIPAEELLRDEIFDALELENTDFSMIPYAVIEDSPSKTVDGILKDMLFKEEFSRMWDWVS